MPLVCERVFAPDSKFWHMWGTRETWRQADPGELLCWDRLGTEQYFDSVGRGQGCDINWFEGAKGDLGLQESRPPFGTDEPAHAVLGFDEDLYRYCSAALGKQQWYDSRGTSEFNDELAHRCVDANLNILRLLSTRPSAGWTMCQNLHWQLCAVQGKLPGQQDDRSVRFAFAPSKLELNEWEHPRSYPCDKGGCEGKYAVGDVFYGEACIFQRICKNKPDMFLVAEGSPVVCELDLSAYHEFTLELRERAGVG